MRNEMRNVSDPFGTTRGNDTKEMLFESRRWRHGDSMTPPINAGIWRMAA